MEDLEEIGPWLDRLYSLNEVIAATAEPLAGNLFYEHHQPNFINSPPSEVLKPKRDSFRSALRDRRRLLEVGVNGGHSAYLALTSNAELEYHGVDICEHAYVLPAVEWLKNEFPTRFFFHPGDCLEVLPRLARFDSLRFDSFHIDGAKHTYFRDILNCCRLANCAEARVIVDDLNLNQVARTWSRCLQLRLLRSDERFPIISEEIRYRHGIATFCTISSSRWRVIDTWARFDEVRKQLDRVRTVKQLPRRVSRRIYREWGGRANRARQPGRG